MTPRRIALLSAMLGGGGAERVMTNLGNGFAANGYNVDMVLMHGTGSYLKDLSPAIRVVDLGARRALGSLLPLVKYLRSSRPDALVVTQAHVNIIAIIARSISKVPIKLVVRETSTPSVIALNARSLRNWVQLGLVRLLYGLADYIVAPSEGVRRDLTQRLGFPEASVKVIRNPLAISWIEARSQEAAGHPWFEEPQTPVVLGIGRLSLQKDFATLLRAFAKVRRVRAARLMILGEGEERSRLQRLVDELQLRDDVLMPGFVDNPYAYLRHSSVYVLSSPSEGSPNTLLEALAVGVPAVATDCPSGPREILEGGRWGRLVPVGDVDAMAAGILAALDGQLSMPDRADLAARYGVDIVLKDYVGLLEAADQIESPNPIGSTWHLYRRI